MRSKYISVSTILCLLLCILLCGCGPIKAINSKLQEIEEDYEFAKKAENKEQLTDEEWDEVNQDVYSEAKWYEKAWYRCTSWTVGKSAATAYADKHRDKQITVSDAKIDAREKEENSKAFKEWFSKNGKIVVVALIIGVALIMVFLFIFLMSRAKKPQVKVVAAPVEARDIEAKEATVNYDKLLIAKCEEKGLDCNSVLEQYGGDARAACEGLMFS